MSRFAHSLLFCLVLHCAAAAEPPHWAYRPITRPAVESSVANPIDHFVALQLQKSALKPAAQAERRTLLRRIYFDLIGLPPSPGELRAFLADTSTNAYERVVDRLLASPRYGERWARHWMDAIHFAETHGHDQDRIRTNAWPYRDYLIASLNSDKPYARFVEEQVAGDALFPQDPQAIVALGFLAAGPWDESSLRDIREDTIDRQIARYLDRDDVVATVMQTFTSTTVQCARCHNHKFDPIPQTDYYALQAVFAGVDRANRTYDSDANVHRKRVALLRERERANKDREWLMSAEMAEPMEAFGRAHSESQGRWKTLIPETFMPAGNAILTRQTNGAVLASGNRPDRDTYTITARAPLARLTAIRLEVLADESLPKLGPGRQDNGNFHLNEFRLLVFEPDAPNGRPVKFASASADFNQSGWTIDHALDGNEKTAWGIHPKVGESHHAVFKLKEPLTIGEDTKLMFVLKQLHGDGHVIGRLRLSVTSEQSPAATTALPADVERILTLPKANRTEDEQVALAKLVVNRRITDELAALPKPSLVYAAASDFEPDGSHKPAGAPRVVHVLKRGDINKPQAAAAPGSLSCVESLQARFEIAEEKNEGARRAALAKWLTDPGNSLTWRSIVNRVWHHHFGRGMVETPNDFGTMGSAPSHPELLDWLSVWFRDDAKGSLKALHRLIVTSATYRRSSTEANKGNKERGSLSPFSLPSVQPDSENHLLSRMNRTRLDADQVRDAILQISGALDLRMGGPSDMQFDLQPGHHVTPKVDYAKFDVDSAQARRRSVYRFLFRTLPDPFMDALDCPAGDQLTPVRNSSVTVQQALAMWNDAFVANYASHFAARLEKHSTKVAGQVTLACELVWCRRPTADEMKYLSDYARDHGLANLCRVLFNSNEFMFVN
ncbi:MAG TPA: DUF1549 and DUF1553 domain-containing protein [Candidatus Acidoferrum sp.]|nr:DUF1549 and DUF1553 domain-containing protein [Candidatus Acidoferrum sp.]